MNPFRAAIAAVLATVFASGPASAAVIDFVAEVLATGEHGVADGSVLNTSRMGNLNLQFKAGIGGERRDFAYFNAATPNGAPAGLGVCTRLDSAAQCNPSSDDTISAREWVEIGFLSGPFNVRALSFNGAGNLSLNNSSGLIKIGTSLGSVLSEFIMSFAEASTYAFGLVDRIRFEFVNTEFVVAKISDVPLPGALPLLLSGLAGLGFAARRKKAR